jgi:hypothetical protein
MLPLNRETLLMVVAVVCVAISLYLYKELNKAKADLISASLPQNKPVSPAPVNDVNKRKPILVKKSVTVKDPAEEEAVEAELTE